MDSMDLISVKFLMYNFKFKFYRKNTPGPDLGFWVRGLKQTFKGGSI